MVYCSSFVNTKRPHEPSLFSLFFCRTALQTMAGLKNGNIAGIWYFCPAFLVGLNFFLSTGGFGTDTRGWSSTYLHWLLQDHLLR